MILNLHVSTHQNNTDTLKKNSHFTKGGGRNCHTESDRGIIKTINLREDVKKD